MNLARTIPVLFFCGILAAASQSPSPELEGVMAERNLEKRSRLALEHADRALQGARAAYDKGDLELAARHVALVLEAVELAETSLNETGKNPRRSPKWFKRAEIAIRELLKKMDAFEREMNVADRDMLAGAKAGIHKVHDNLLTGLMEGKK